MADITLTLGDIVFDGLEIPPVLKGGGEQALKIHKLLGGARVVDALGRDDGEYTWDGRFQGSDAEDRAQAVDQIRQAGQPVTLTWGTRSYTVVVSKFLWDWERVYQIVYSIACVIIDDNTTAPATSTATLDDLVGGDMASINAIVPSLTEPTIGPAIAAINSAIATVGTLQGAALAALGPVSAAVQTAKGVIATVLTALDSATQTNAGSVAGIVSGGNALTMIATFTAQSNLINQQWQVQEVSSLVDRVATNLALATG